MASKRRRIKNPSFYYDPSRKVFISHGRKIKEKTALRKIREQNLSKIWVKSKKGKFYRDNKIIDRLYKWVGEIEKKKVERVKIPENVLFFYEIKTGKLKNRKGRIISLTENIFRYLLSSGFIYVKQGKVFKQDNGEIFIKVLSKWLKENAPPEKQERTYTSSYDISFLIRTLPEFTVDPNIRYLFQAYSEAFDFSRNRIFLYSDITIEKKGQVNEFEITSKQFTEEMTEDYTELIVEDFENKMRSFEANVIISDVNANFNGFEIVYKGW